MKGSVERNIDPLHNPSKKNSNFKCLNIKNHPGSVSSEAEPSVGNSKHKKSGPLLSGIWPTRNSSSNSSKSDSTNCGSDSCYRKKSVANSYYDSWRASVRRVMMNGGSMRRILGFGRTDVSTSKSDIWLLGVCYCVATEGDDASAYDPAQSEGFAAFVEDFSSRVLVTYRRGFAPIGETKYSSDVNWGCMIRSSQMLVAQAFLCHKLGRSWRKFPHKPLDQSYLEILHLFGDSESSPCSIHNLLKAGKAYGLAAGSWVGPYAMCRTWESLLRDKREETDNGVLSSMMPIYVVSGDEDGERGGAPVLCIEDVSRACSEFSKGQVEWSSILLMVPLVLGLDKVNPRYLPLLTATFTFPQSLGVLGGKPGASTYLIGVQDDKAFYLDPHEVQQAVEIKRDSVDVDTSSYHCNVVRNMPLDSIDSSLAIGFYCKDKSDFDDFCQRTSDLINQSNGAPLFTISKTRRPVHNNDAEIPDYDPVNGLHDGESADGGQEDDWQFL